MIFTVNPIIFGKDLDAKIMSFVEIITSSISGRTKYYLVRGGGAGATEVTSPALTGSDVSHVTGSMFCTYPDFPPYFFFGFPCFFLTIVVVQVVQ